MQPELIVSRRFVRAFTFFAPRCPAIVTQPRGFRFLSGRRNRERLHLTLNSAKASGPPATVTSPAFFDEPRFTVAGVTDTTNLGGHGSDTVVRNREALAQATASLSRQLPGESSVLQTIPQRKNLCAKPSNASRKASAQTTNSGDCSSSSEEHRKSFRTRSESS